MLNKQIIDEAAEWFVEFNTDEPDAQMCSRFDAWLRKSPEHVRSYLEMFPIWKGASSVDRDLTFSAEQLIALARGADRNVVPLLPGRAGSLDVECGGVPGKRRTIPSRHQYAAAASLLLVVAGLGGWLYFQRDTYTTDIGEQRVITSPDGSNIELNARSKIRLRFDGTERRVELIAGQALFQVAKDAHRPFVVESGHTKVRAVGTRFDVNRKLNGVTVTVVEGRVAVNTSQASQDEGRAGSNEPRPIASSESARPYPTDIIHESDTKQSAGSSATRVPMNERSSGSHEASPQPTSSEILLAAGEQLTVTATAVERPAHANVASATAWRQHLFVFSSTPLPEVAEEFNRYNERQLLILSPALRTFNVSAVFSVTDLQSLMRFLRAQHNITVEETNREIRVSGDPG